MSRGWLLRLSVIGVCAALGSWWVTGQFRGRLAEALIPEALGVPSALPHLRLWPMPGQAWSLWLADLVGVAVLVAFVVTPPHRRQILWVALGAVCAGVVRLAWISVVAQHDLVTFGIALALTVVLCGLAGLLVGVFVALMGKVADRFLGVEIPASR